MNEENDKKDIEVVQGIGNLDISPVFDNATSAKPKMQDEKPKNIVIPQVKKKIEKDREIKEDNEITNEEPVDDSEDTFEEDVQENTDSEEFDVEQIEFEDIDLDSDSSQENNN